ncbi:hypothetical protein [Microbacterium sp.]|uniref:hypothetical protein n=1 Tax=Microbacterium sp. TaxID=51671 RepID=UPI0033427C3D
MKFLRTEAKTTGGKKDRDVVIVVTRDDLVLLSNAVSEALEALEEWEFSIRVGASTAEARAMKAALKDLLDKTRRRA